MRSFPVNSDKMLFMDIETCGISKDLESLPEHLKSVFTDRYDWWVKRFPEHDDQDEMFVNRAALVAEFSKILVVSFGWENKGEFHKKSFSSVKEARDFMDRSFKQNYWLCGHNIKNFDIPLLAKKCLKIGLKAPLFAPTTDQKPWELKVIDTSSYYKFGNSYSLSSIDIISAALNLPTPKDGEVNGKNLHAYYYGIGKEADKLTKIKDYCELDVEWVYNFVKYIENLK